MALAVAARLAGAPLEPSRATLLALPSIGAALWSLEQSGFESPKWLRALSGLALGLGLGWVIGLHLREPWPRELLEVLGIVTLVALAGLVGRFRLERGGGLRIAAPLLPDPPGGEGEKKQTDPQKMK